MEIPNHRRFRVNMLTVMWPFQGRVWWLGSIQIGSRPYPRLFDPFGVFPYEANALKGQYNLTPGLAPVNMDIIKQKCPCKGLIS